MAGFTGAARNPFFRRAPHLYQFDDGLGTRLPRDTNHPDFPDPGFLNEEIRAVVLATLNRIDEYVLRFARGDGDAMTRPQKRAAVLFCAKANCVTCHAVGGPTNEMFSDFQNHVLGVPQLVLRSA